MEILALFQKPILNTSKHQNIKIQSLLKEYMLITSMEVSKNAFTSVHKNLQAHSM
jgi:hypothetical protein